MESEISFLNLSQEACPEFTPSVYHIDYEKKIIILEHILGHYFQARNQITEGDLMQARAFYRKLNKETKLCNQFIKNRAEEGFITLEEHVNNIENRIRRLKLNHLKDAFFNDAAKVLDETRSKWVEIKANFEKEMNSSSAIASRLPLQYLQVSPSDFGFHNAIKTNSGIKFFDFEFAGWDDPAKTVCDFFNQPKIKVPKNYHGLISSSFAVQCPVELLTSRIRVLYPLIHIKWVCIILNVLDPEKFQEYSLRDQDMTTFIKDRIKTATEKLKEPGIDLR